jgi:hypothetical protein
MQVTLLVEVLNPVNNSYCFQQNQLFTPLLYITLNIRKYKTVIIPVVLCGYELDLLFWGKNINFSCLATEY